MSNFYSKKMGFTSSLNVNLIRSEREGLVIDLALRCDLALLRNSAKRRVLFFVRA